MSRFVTVAAASAIAVLLNAACAPELDDRTVLFEECMKNKAYSTEVCQCVVDAQIKTYDKDVLRVFVLRAQGKHGEADRLMQSLPSPGDQILKVSIATTACNAGG